MTINEGMKKFRLPNPTTPEDLACRWSKMLNFNGKIVIAGYYILPLTAPDIQSFLLIN